MFLNSEILLNWLMDDCHLSYITKLEMGKKKIHWQRHNFLLAKIIAMPVRPLCMFVIAIMFSTSKLCLLCSYDHSTYKSAF